MRKILTGIRLLLGNRKAFVLSIFEKIGFLFGDKLYLKIQFKLRMGEALNLVNPQTFSEKLQWLKLYDRNPLYSRLVDKYEVKEYVSSVIGAQYVIPTLGVWDSVDSIEWEELPNQFVLKTTQGGGSYGVILCRDKSSINKPNVSDNLRKALSQNIYKTLREWPYKNLQGRVLAEELLEQDGACDLTDYKFFCFNGEPKFLYVRTESPMEHKRYVNFITTDWEPAQFYRPDCPPSAVVPEKPQQFDEMCELARKLSDGFPFLRVDLYEVNSRVYFSELTFYPSSGLLPFEPREWDKKIGDMLTLPQ